MNGLDAAARHTSTRKGFDYYVVLYIGKAIMGLCRGPAILEMGPADGLMTKMLCRRFAEVTAVDGSAYLLKRAVSYVRSDRVRFVHALFEDYSPGTKFDTIVMTHVLEHVADPVRILRRAKGWLKRSGKLIACVPNAYSLHRQIGVAMSLLKDEHDLNEKDRSIGHRRVYDMKRLRRCVSAAGLRVVSAGGVLLKPLSNNQLMRFDKAYFDALYEVGKRFPDICSEIYVEAAK